MLCEEKGQMLCWPVVVPVNPSNVPDAALVGDWTGRCVVQLWIEPEPIGLPVGGTAHSATRSVAGSPVWCFKYNKDLLFAGRLCVDEPEATSDSGEGSWDSTPWG
jgi:hypothetical protein